FNALTLTASASDTDTASCPARFHTPPLAFSFAWSIAAKPVGALPSLSVGSGGNTATFTGDMAGIYQVQAVATASSGAVSVSPPATVTVLDCLAGPVANAFTATQTVPSGTLTSTLH